MLNYKKLFFGVAIATLVLSCQDGTDTSGSNSEAGLDVWATPELVSVSEPSYSWYPDVAVNQNGDAVAVWREDEGTGQRATVFINTYSDPSGWGTPAILDPGIGIYWSGYAPRIAMNKNGDAIVGWQMEDDIPGRYRMWI